MNRNFRTIIADLTLAFKERRFNDAVKLIGECFQYAGGLMDMLFGGSVYAQADDVPTAGDVTALRDAVADCETAPTAAAFDWAKLITLAKIILDLLAQMPKS